MFVLFQLTHIAMPVCSVHHIYSGFECDIRSH